MGEVRSTRPRVRYGLAVSLALSLIGTLLVVGVSGEAGGASSSSTKSGVWAGVGKVCAPGPGGASSVRGVGQNTIHIAVFNDQSNSEEPGLGKEFVQFAGAFASWCNAAGGINGRKIVVDSRDGALFNAAQVTNEACQSDFMAVGGGLVLDAPAVPVRVGCGLGQITGETVSDAADKAALQVNPNNISPTIVSTGFFPALAKAYPKAVKNAGMGGLNIASAEEPEIKWKDAANAQGWNVTTFQAVPVSVSDWSPYVLQLQSKDVQAVWPAVTTTGGLPDYYRAMQTAGYNPSFLLLSSQFYAKATLQAMQGVKLPPVYVASGWWPYELASQSPGLTQLVQVMNKYGKGDTLDFWDEMAASGWLLWAKSASACRAKLSVSCVLYQAESVKNWSAGNIQAPVTQITASNESPMPSPCFILLTATTKKFVYNKAITRPTQSIWNCNPKNNYTLTSQQAAGVGAN